MSQFIQTNSRWIAKKLRALKRRSIAVVSRFRSSATATSFFENKRVVLLGPNASIDENLIHRIQQCDLCALVNKGYRLSYFEILRKYAKEIVLFHCLDQDENTGGGVVDSKALRKMGITTIIYPLCENRLLHKVAKFHQENSSFLKLYEVEKAYYVEMQQAIDGFTPNSGAAAMSIISKAPGSYLYVTGFSFYRTNYKAEYAPQLDSLEKTIAMIEKYHNHNPDLDFLNFKKQYEERNIEVDSELEEILKQPYVPMFYQQKTTRLF